ncbi:MAG: putative zinc-binding protein [Desulfobacteraceae bacterium]
MSDDCCCSNNNTMILACSGGSNVGQLSNQAAIDLTQEGFGKMFCLAGIGGSLSGFVQSAKDVGNLVVIDGCQVGCAKAILEKNGIENKNYTVITDLGIEKNKDFNLKAEDLETVKTKIKSSRII